MFKLRDGDKGILHSSFGSLTALRIDREICNGDTVKLKTDAATYGVVVSGRRPDGAYLGVVDDSDWPGWAQHQQGPDGLTYGAEVSFLNEHILACTHQ